MYDISDRGAVVSEIQKYLHLIHTNGERDIPRVAIDGIFGKETKYAVSEFQRMRGLGATGIVNKETFDALYLEYREIIDFAERETPLTGELALPLSLGTQGSEVLILNLYLAELQKNYKDIGRVDKSAYYSPKTENAVKDAQKIFRMAENGVVDDRFYNRLLLELYALRRKNDEY